MNTGFVTSETNQKETFIVSLITLLVILVIGVITNELYNFIPSLDFSGIIYLSPLLVLVFYFAYEKFGFELLQKYPPSALEAFLLLISLFLVLTFWKFIPEIDHRITLPNEAYLTRIFGYAYPIYLGLIGFFFGRYLTLLSRRIRYKEQEKTLKRVILVQHFCLGFLLLPFIAIMIIDGIVFIPLSLWKTEPILTFVYAFVGFNFVLYPLQISSLHILSFFTFDKYVDRIRILRELNETPQTIKQLKKKINPEKVDFFVKELLKNHVIEENNNKLSILRKT